MSIEPVAVQESCRDDLVPSRPPGTGQAASDGGGISAAMGDHGGHKRRVKLELPRGPGPLPHARTIERVSTVGLEEGGLQKPRASARPWPYYVPPSRRRPPPFEEWPASPPGAPGAGGGIGPIGRTRKKPVAHPHPGEAALPAAEEPGGALPPVIGGALAQAWTIERVSALDHPNGARYVENDAPPHQTSGHFPWRKHASGGTQGGPSGAMIIAPRNSGDNGQMGQPSPLLLPKRMKKRPRRPVAFCCFLCCILFSLLVVSMSVAVLVVHLLYHPQPPQLRVTTATLNSGYIDYLPPPRGGFKLNSDLRALATIYNPNTRIDVVLRYLQMDLYFQGVIIGTTQAALWPPIHEHPGDSTNRTVQLVVTNVRIPLEDAEVWHNATTIRGGLLELQLFTMIHAQLNFSRRLHFRYWVFTRCTLWLHPPPRGALHRAQCQK